MMRAAGMYQAVLLVTLATTVGARAGDTVMPETITIPAGYFIAGSNQAERTAAYDLDQAAYGHDRVRKWGWYDDERPRQKFHMPAFDITRRLVSNRQYAAFIAATAHPAPDVDKKTWRGYGLIHPYHRTRRHAWTEGRPPAGREHHPVVMVSHQDASAYAAWLSRQGVGQWRLPTELEWEKAARGAEGRRYPWGDIYDARNLNSHDGGPFDTMAVGLFPHGASPYGLLDPAGQVFEWTATAARKAGRFLVKGGSWDDKGCGICRPAARHGRPAAIKHILIGFRLIRE
ncbi:MAG: SUMF1/EgtB/PvdO family nonheme iron enzyme [Rhodospirillaceae bacterium]|jgi:toxoflavin biosynthesis protein ToxD|nr:SUMF1/EgtB/PvdO family nonheme iron enzyme [Rhodospirillaceae bacterium]MBT4486980.1 SUMF1/EgtB/PvdO family nonheme iron enzyme [Rhodospirillaceae bacterium]MBT5191784.1 SUMF1/EgtB/PvdO family nonheme iron enzyme [Rhodospirillaceae bacterium]MBT5894485.1 SUMF1/EgtB/PvdO family nonheme iron enzyme [Rhodospirillaceae bacterium]MBT6431187.1 SUMF1/EgtB/PvdO family nonheme iron enzyme [Rhodospirillaceae bacterium]